MCQMRLSLFFFSLFLLIGCGAETDSTTDANPTTNDDASSTDGEDSQDSDQEKTADSNDSTDAAGPDEQETLFVIDVRTKDEWDKGHVETAVHIPHTEIADRIGEVTEQKDAKILVYCAVGGRAGVAKKALEELGYTNVENGGGLKDVKGRFEDD